ncbi:MAG: UDP-N-acetylmuramate--L-alanine ligase [Chloroflexi bacterium RBG_16_52_11]|nr:MAG: UDP-N-acetylmuramate--L-alanine ligase [Chloroflexi bacterium RBG_16_52_11]
MTHVHFIGIGGSGLSAMARLLLENGEEVSGSDHQLTSAAKDVQAAGALVYIGHRPENILNAELVVRSSAIPDDNVEVQAALAAGIPVYRRADFLSKLLHGYRVIAIAGTHGKTTTTAMIAWMLTALRVDPSYIVGSVSLNLKNNAHAGQSDLFVIEADEYDRMFLGLNPWLAVVTNIEHDHPDCYPTGEDFWQAFYAFVSRMVPDGILLACLDDPGGERLLQQVNKEGRAALSYGLERLPSNTGPDYYALNLATNNLGGFSFDMYFGQWLEGYSVPMVRVELQVPGRHNVSNALSAIAVADLVGLPVLKAAKALSEFRGTDRRFEVRGEANGVLVIDDYAHHPTEIKATLAAARARYPQRRIWSVWQPHTYSRTRTLFDQFAGAFDDADTVLVTEVYAARETPPKDGFSASQVVEAMSRPDVLFTPDISQATELLVDKLQPGDVLLVLSAGDANQISTDVLLRMKEKT